MYPCRRLLKFSFACLPITSLVLLIFWLFGDKLPKPKSLRDFEAWRERVASERVEPATNTKPPAARRTSRGG